jgi:NifB/MoaA-like Fe-S oxidoreductase
MSDLAVRPAKISAIVKDSLAEELGFEAGDAVVSINGSRPRDLIDYQFFCADEFLELEVLDRKGVAHTVEVRRTMTRIWGWSLKPHCLMA